jgi:hypothetical protein
VSYSIVVPGVTRYLRRLAGFTRVAVPAGQTVTATVVVRQVDLDRFDDAVGAYTIDSGVYTIYAGDCLESGYSGPNRTPCLAPMLSATLTLT